MMIGAALLGYAVLPSDRGLYITATLVFCVAVFVARMLLRRRARHSPRSWQVMPAGFTVEPARFGDLPPLLLLMGALLIAAVDLGATLRAHGWSEQLLPEPGLLLLAFYAFRMLRRHRGSITLSPAGLALGSRLYPWKDVRLAYLHFDLRTAGAAGTPSASTVLLTAYRRRISIG